MKKSIKITPALAKLLDEANSSALMESAAKDESRRAWNDAMKENGGDEEKTQNDPYYQRKHKNRVDATERRENAVAAWNDAANKFLEPFAEVEGKASARTMDRTELADLIFRMQRVLQNVGTKKELEGTLIVRKIGAGKYPTAYKYKVIGTVTRWKYHAASWVCIGACREDVKHESPFLVYYSEAAETAILKKLAEGAMLS